jgi:DNA-binding transcriptional LysR family regulator
MKSDTTEYQKNVRQLERGEVDLVIGWFGELPGGMRRATLFREKEAIVVRAGHPQLKNSQ